jgi:hypothetical protein
MAMVMCVGMAVFMACISIEEVASAGVVGCRLIAEAGYGVVTIFVGSQCQGLEEGDVFSSWGNLSVCSAMEGICRLGVSLLYWRAGYAWDSWQGFIRVISGC